ncbi:NVEALA domain-containing protein [Bacteroides sp. AN502(2024)]|uniref:NVEALA domain-containing protein n=1 Tax=Bacteroides sp. AN502(2024) TaxID=3160599 RepID=UPI00351727CB
MYTSQNNVKLSALALANVEALARYELPDVEITCGSESGKCWSMYGDCYVSWVIRYENCRFTGYTYDSCVTPCD